jgi:hypothetical protein
MAVADPQHLLAVGLVTSALPPQLGGLNGRHQQFNRAGAILFFAHDGADLLQRPKAERQEGVYAGGLLAHHAGTQHQPVRSDFRFFRRFTQSRQEVAGAAHEFSVLCYRATHTSRKPAEKTRVPAHGSNGQSMGRFSPPQSDDKRPRIN